jgi:hypothetical protein
MDLSSQYGTGIQITGNDFSDCSTAAVKLERDHGVQIEANQLEHGTPVLFEPGQFSSALQVRDSLSSAYLGGNSKFDSLDAASTIKLAGPFGGVGPWQNYFKNSEDVSRATWRRGTAISLARAGTAPDGRHNAIEIAANVGGSPTVLNYTDDLQGAVKGTYTCSFWIRSDQPGALRMALASDNFDEAEERYIALSANWTRVWIAHEFNKTSRRILTCGVTESFRSWCVCAYVFKCDG